MSWTGSRGSFVGSGRFYGKEAIKFYTNTVLNFFFLSLFFFLFHSHQKTITSNWNPVRQGASAAQTSMPQLK
jgi:hypothetical protein